MSNKKQLEFIFVDTGSKLNYAACVEEDGKLLFCSWIRKYCAKDTDTIIKKTKEEIGL